MIRITANNKPLISVIIPAYNEERHIRFCLESLVQQHTNVPFEIIVVNNNSTDKTETVVKSFANVRIIQEKHQGLAHTRNAGAKHAKSNLLVFVDADCVTFPDHLQKIYQYFLDYPTAEVLTGPYVYDDGGLLIRWITQYLEYYRLHFMISRLLFGVQMILGGNVAFRKKTFAMLKGFDESISNINDPEDLEMAIRCRKLHVNVHFDPTLRVFSSFRRMNRAGLKEGMVRIINQYTRLLHFLFTG